MSQAGPLVYVIAGEPSGDLLGGRLMASLKAQTGGEVRFLGVGGPRMEGEGLESRMPLSELAVMGLAELIPHIPRIRRRIAETVAHIREVRPDVLVTIDAPGFNFRVAKQLVGEGIPLVHYVAPTVWAWRPGRARKVARFLDHLLCILPFEPPYFEKHGLGCTYVGYPAIEDAVGGDRAACREALDAGPDTKILCAMPGSRRREIDKLLPIFEGAVSQLAERVPDLLVVMPTVPNVEDLVVPAVGRWKVPVTVVADPTVRKDLFAGSDVALVKSGTASAELAAAGVPAVVTQKVSWTSAFLFLLMRKIKFVSVVNLIAEAEVQPERLQWDCTSTVLADVLEGLLANHADRDRRREVGLEIAAKLGAGDTPPSDLAARAVLAQLHK